mgnify:CR=1 FL=1
MIPLFFRYKVTPADNRVTDRKKSLLSSRSSFPLLLLSLWRLPFLYENFFAFSSCILVSQIDSCIFLNIHCPDNSHAHLIPRIAGAPSCPFNKALHYAHRGITIEIPYDNLPEGLTVLLALWRDDLRSCPAHHHHPKNAKD